MYGYMAAANYVDLLKTSFVRKGRFLSAMGHLGITFKGREAEVMADWEVEVRAFDADLHRDEKTHHCGVIAALLCLYRSHPREDVAAFFEKIQMVSFTRLAASKFHRSLNLAEQVIDDLDTHLKQVEAKNNESIIARKKALTVLAYENFQALLRAEGQKESVGRPRKTVKPT